MSSEQLLHFAAIGELDDVQSLLFHGADVNYVREGVGATALYFASREGHLDIVKTLLENGANTEISTKDGDTPLYAAAFGGHLEVVEFLLSVGANIEATDDLDTPLFTSHRREDILMW